MKPRAQYGGVGSDRDPVDVREQPGHSNLSACLSNLSIQYNYQCAGIATAIMLSHNDDPVAAGQAGDFPQPAWADMTLLGMVFMGSVTGMLLMGYLGDLIGSRRALTFTMAMTAFSAVATSIMPWGSPQTVWAMIAAGRFFLGVGIGGAYPLSASHAASSSGSESPGEKTACAFFWQQPGAVAPYIIAFLLLRLPHANGITSLQFRLILGLGAIPAFASLCLALREKDHRAREPPPDSIEPKTSIVWSLSRQQLRTLVGTAGTWLFFDIYAYGITVFTPGILTTIFGHTQTLTELTLRSLAVTFIGLPSTFLGIRLLPHVGCTTLNNVGGAICAGIFCLLSLGAYFNVQPVILFVMLCLAVFSFGCGPNVGTFVQPVVCFSPGHRASLHGVSAAAGKVGALIGTLTFPALKRYLGMHIAMAFLAVAAAVGVLLGLTCLDPMVADVEGEPLQGNQEDDVKRHPPNGS